MQNKEEAVSPVIGVILMVAITVILAAVVAAFAMGMVSVPKPKTVTATATRSAQNVIVTWQGGLDNDMVTNYTVRLDGPSGTVFTKDISGNSVGQGTVISAPPGVQYRAVVTASFSDGSQQVVLDGDIL